MSASDRPGLHSLTYTLSYRQRQALVKLLSTRSLGPEDGTIRIDLDQIGFVGQDLARPECVLADAAGRLHVADWRGGVTVIEPDGRQRRILGRDAPVALRPNGVCLLDDGSHLVTHLGADAGGVYHLAADGCVTPFLLEVDGRPLPPTNYVHRDPAGRTWVTVSTGRSPRDLAYRADVADGFVVLVDEAGARIVADGLGYTNECLLHPDGERLFVNETFGRRLTSFRVGRDGRLGRGTTVATFGEGTFPDGLTADAEGGLWITSIVSNRVIRVDEAGRQEVILEDADPEHVAWVEAAFRRGEMGRPHLDTVRSRRLRNVSSLAFGGPDLRTAYLGCLLGDRLATFPAPVAGYPPPHWRPGAAAPDLRPPHGGPTT